MSCTEFNFVRCLHLLQVSTGYAHSVRWLPDEHCCRCPCGSRPFRVVFNVQDLLRVPLGIESVDVRRLVLSKQTKLVEGDTPQRNHTAWDFLICFTRVLPDK